MFTPQKYLELNMVAEVVLSCEFLENALNRHHPSQIQGRTNMR